MDIKDNLLTLADGNEMPQEGFGLYKVDGQATMNQAVKKAYEDGYRLFDTAQLYGNEQEVGTAFKQLTIPRDNIFVTTKVAEENQGYDTGRDRNLDFLSAGSVSCSGTIRALLFYDLS